MNITSYTDVTCMQASNILSKNIKFASTICKNRLKIIHKILINLIVSEIRFFLTLSKPDIIYYQNEILKKNKNIQI